MGELAELLTVFVRSDVQSHCDTDTSTFHEKGLSPPLAPSMEVHTLPLDR